MRLLTLALCAVPPLSMACVAMEVEPPADEQPAGAQPADAEPYFATEEGEFGRVRVQTVDGPMLLSYQVRNGHAIHETDVDLGPVSELRLRGGAARLGERWPGGVIRYAFDQDFVGQVCEPWGNNCMYVRDRVRQVLAAMEEKLPLDFREVPPEDTLGEDLIVFAFEDREDPPGASSHTGMQGGWQWITFRAGHAQDDAPYFLNYHLQPGAGTTRHEVLHAIGLWHEQSRNDRGAFIDVKYDCIEDGSDNGNYEVREESADLGPYDFASIMHYSDRAQCLAPLVPELDPDGDGCQCRTMVPRPKGAAFGSGEARGRGGFSIEDTNTVFRMYAQPPGVNAAGERFGEVVAAGDFDGDGYDDLAVGAPNEDVMTGTAFNHTTHRDAGRVFLWKGTPGGLVAWDVLIASQFEGEQVSALARFGTALVAYDLDGDGVDDLAIGAPGARGGAGAAYVLRGSIDLGLRTHRVLTQANTGADDDESGDRFGEALAAGPLTGVKDACAGTRFVDALVVGAPGNDVPAGINISARTGSVFVFQETRDACSQNFSLNKPTRLSHNKFNHSGSSVSDEFGTALAVGDLEADGRADLAIGAPGFNGGAGKVYLYKGQLPAGAPSAWPAMAAYQRDLSFTGTLLFGEAVAIGAIRPTARQLVVGAPGGSGRVLVFSNNFDFNFYFPTTLESDLVEAGDEFGATLAIGNLVGTTTYADLVIGAPGEDQGAGAVVVVHGGTSLSTRTNLTQTQEALTGGDRDAGDRFGSSFAIGSFDGRERNHTAESGSLRLDLAVGAPGETPELFPFNEDSAASGAVDTFRGVSGGTLSGWQHRHQEGAGQATGS